MVLALIVDPTSQMIEDCCEHTGCSFRDGDCGDALLMYFNISALNSK